MFFEQEFIERVKESNPLFDLANEYMTFKDNGSTYKANCISPGHVTDKTPSVKYFKDNDTMHCFGCGADYQDSISFLMDIEQMEFKDAVVYLANRAGLELPDEDADEEMKEHKKIRAKLMNKARDFYKNLNDMDFRHVKDYLIDRGITQELIDEFKLGYCHFINKQSDDYKDFKKFTKRITFPIFDGYDRIIGFGARKLPSAGDDWVKYINSGKEIPFFDKSKTVYNLDKAKSEMIKKGYGFWFEGYTDTILAHKYGVKNAVASLGTAITNEQVRLISNYTDTIYLYMDSDDAGEKSMKRALKIFDEHDVTLKLLKEPKGLDPAEKFKEVGNNFEDWALSAAKTVEQYYVDMYMSDYNRKMIDAKRELVKDLSETFSDRIDKIETDFALSSVCNITDMSIKTLKNKIKEVS